MAEIFAKLAEDSFLAFLFIIGLIISITLICRWIIALVKFITKKRFLLKPQKMHLELLARQKSQGFPWLAEAYSEYFYLCDSEIANYLEVKKHPARKSAEIVREVAAQRRISERLYRILKYKLEYYESLFPWLVDFGDESIDDLIKQTIERMQSGGKPIGELEDAVEIYTTDGERGAVLKKKLSKQELF